MKIMTYDKPTFVRFSELNDTAINRDLHIHTTQTDGKATIEEVARAAQDCGLSQIAYTEHVRRDTLWFPKFAADVRSQRSQFPILEIWIGCEAKALDNRGSLDINAEIIDNSQLILGSVHRFPDGLGGYMDFARLSQNECAQIEFELAWGLLDAAPIDVLAHPGGMYYRCYKQNFPEHLMRQLLNKSLERGIAVEINSMYLQDINTFLHLCADINPFISVGSDVHDLSQIGSCRDQLRTCGAGKP
jgi:putative hydrolase